MKRRILSLLLVCMLLCGTWSIASVHAYSETDIAYPVEGGNLYFDKISGAITDCDESVTSADIPSEIDGASVVSIGFLAFSNCGSLTSVTIPNSVTSIGDSAFSDCISLTRVTIPEGVTSIGGGAFSSCSSLTCVTIPESVTSIGNSAFSRCSSLTAIYVAEGNTAYTSEDGVLFSKDKTMLHIYPAGKMENEYAIPNSVTSIGEWAFSDCNSLTSVTIPDSVTSIGNSAFYSCNSLTSVTIPDSVTSIGDSAFSWCSSLTNVAIPDSVMSIGSCAFLGTAIYEAEDSWIDGVLYIGNWLTEAKDGSAYIIREGTRGIADSAFSGCSSLTSVTIPESVTSIGHAAFSGCSSLTSVTIPESVTSIGEDAFSGCSSLTAIYVAEGNTAYTSEDGVLFSKDKNMLHSYPAGKTEKEYAIPDSVTTIDSSAFYGCSSLTSVMIPESVTSISEGAFSHCSSLTSVTIPNSVTYIGDSAFSGCSSLTSVTIPNSVTSIGDSAFSHCSSLISVTIPNSVTSIGDYAFSWCSSLTNVAIPDSVTYIDSSAFYGCSSLTSITIPSSVTSIGWYAFADCTGLTSVCFMGNAPELGDNVFQLWDDEKETHVNNPDLTLYYIKDKEGWTSPTWNGYPTATWKPVEPTPPVEFVDVPQNEWYVGAVNYAVKNGLMGGTSANTFEPESAMTRAMLVTVL